MCDPDIFCLECAKVGLHGLAIKLIKTYSVLQVGFKGVNLRELGLISHSLSRPSLAISIMVSPKGLHKDKTLKLVGTWFPSSIV